MGHTSIHALFSIAPFKKIKSLPTSCSVDHPTNLQGSHSPRSRRPFHCFRFWPLAGTHPREVEPPRRLGRGPELHPADRFEIGKLVLQWLVCKVDILTVEWVYKRSYNWRSPLCLLKVSNQMFYHQRRVDYGHQFYGVPCLFPGCVLLLWFPIKLEHHKPRIGDMASG